MPKGNPAGYLPRTKQKKARPDPHPSASKGKLGGLADKVRQAAALRKSAKGIVAAPPSSPGGLKLRDAVKGRKPQYGVNKDRRLTYEEAIARRSSDSSKARAAAHYGKTYTPGAETPRNTVPNAAPGAAKPKATAFGLNRDNAKRDQKRKKYTGRRFDSRG